MIEVTKFLDSFISGGNRIIKVLSAGFSSARTGVMVHSFGEDSNPVLWKPIYAKTANESQPVIIGFVNPSPVNLNKGEKIIFSTDAEGKESFLIKLTNDKKLELGGNSDNAVRYTPLNSGIQQLNIDIQAELVKISTAITALGGAYIPGVLSVDISDSKIDEIKTS